MANNLIILGNGGSYSASFCVGGVITDSLFSNAQDPSRTVWSVQFAEISGGFANSLPGGLSKVTQTGAPSGAFGGAGPGESFDYSIVMQSSTNSDVKFRINNGTYVTIAAVATELTTYSGTITAGFVSLGFEITNNNAADHFKISSICITPV
tara:strand:+ start:1024 stop:1479 length:456 start_codon:yes stop_codon:yes gene_type:complete